MAVALCSACIAKLSARSCSIHVARRSKGFLLFVPMWCVLGERLRTGSRRMRGPYQLFLAIGLLTFS